MGSAISYRADEVPGVPVNDSSLRPGKCDEEAPSGAAKVAAARLASTGVPGVSSELRASCATERVVVSAPVGQRKPAGSSQSPWANGNRAVRVGSLRSSSCSSAGRKPRPQEWTACCRRVSRPCHRKRTMMCLLCRDAATCEKDGMILISALPGDCSEARCASGCTQDDCAEV